MTLGLCGLRANTPRERSPRYQESQVCSLRVLVRATRFPGKQRIISAGGWLIVTGRGEPEFERAVKDAAAHSPDNTAAIIRFDDGEARRIFAASDFTLMPSRFEPCGLSQMYAQRFGSLPIGRQTGGLSETIIDGQTGFLFVDSSIAYERGHARNQHLPYKAQAE